MNARVWQKAARDHRDVWRGIIQEEIAGSLEMADRLATFAEYMAVQFEAEAEKESGK